VILLAVLLKVVSTEEQTLSFIKTLLKLLANSNNDKHSNLLLAIIFKLAENLDSDFLFTPYSDVLLIKYLFVLNNETIISNTNKVYFNLFSKNLFNLLNDVC
jgi:hypothetical protein